MLYAIPNIKCSCGKTFDSLPKDYTLQSGCDELSGIYINCEKCKSTKFIKASEGAMDLLALKYGYKYGYPILDHSEIDRLMRESKTTESYLLCIKYRQNRHAYDWAKQELETGKKTFYEG